MSEQTPNIPQPPRGYTPPAAQPTQQAQQAAPYAAAPVAQQPAQPVQQPYTIAPGPHYVHKSVIALWTIRAGLVIFFSILFSSIGAFTALAEHTRNPGLWVVLILMLVFLVSFGIMFVVSYISYKRFTWEVTDTELHVRRGLISIKNTHIPFQRIHSLDSTATLLDRALGLVTLNVQTAGSARPEATINGLKLQDAEALRAEIFARKRFAAYQAQAQAQARYAQGTGGAFNAAVDGAVASAAGTMSQVASSIDSIGAGGNVIRELGNVSDSVRGVFGGAAIFDEAPIEFEYKLSNKELILASISGASITGAFATLLATLVPLLGSAAAVWTAVERMAADIASGGLAGVGTLALIIIGSILLAVIVWIASALSQALTYGNFTVRRRGGRIEVEKGLLAHRFNGVALDRIQSVLVKEGFVRRLFGYAEVRVSTVSNVAGGDSGNNSGSNPTDAAGVVVHPFIKRADVPAFIATALPEFANVPEGAALQQLPKVALRRALFRWSLWPFLTFLVCAIITDIVLVVTRANFPLWFAPLLAFLLALPGIPTAILWYRNARFGHSRDMLTLRKGAYGLSTTYTYRRRIQFIQALANPFQRHAKVATIVAETAAGDSSITNSLRDLSQEAADELLDWIRPRGHAQAALIHENQE